MTTTTALGADKATDERALFESESLRLDIIDDEGFERYDSGDYVDEPSHVAWRAWQARAALDAVPASEPVAQLTKERDMWKANHDAMRDRCSILRQRTDLPVDRIPAYEALVAAQNLASLYTAAPAPVSGMPDLARLTRYVQDLDDAILPVDQARENPSGAEYFAAADVERLLNPTGETK